MIAWQRIQSLDNVKLQGLLSVTRERTCTGTNREITMPILQHFQTKNISNTKSFETYKYPALVLRVLRLPKVPLSLMRLISERRE